MIRHNLRTAHTGFTFTEFGGGDPNFLRTTLVKDASGKAVAVLIPNAGCSGATIYRGNNQKLIDALNELMIRDTRNGGPGVLVQRLYRKITGDMNCLCVGHSNPKCNLANPAACTLAMAEVHKCLGRDPNAIIFPHLRQNRKILDGIRQAVSLLEETNDYVPLAVQTSGIMHGVHSVRPETVRKHGKAQLVAKKG
jgi:hypothetical protein